MHELKLRTWLPYCISDMRDVTDELFVFYVENDRKPYIG